METEVRGLTGVDLFGASDAVVKHVLEVCAVSLLSLVLNECKLLFPQMINVLLYFKFNRYQVINETPHSKLAPWVRPHAETLMSQLKVNTCNMRATVQT